MGRHEEGVAARNLCRQNEKRKERHCHKDKKVSNQKLCRVQDHGHLALHHHEHLRWEDNVQKGNNLMPNVGGKKGVIGLKQTMWEVMKKDRLA